MELAQWCKEQRGRQQGLSKHLGVKQPVVAAWLSRRRPVPVEHGAAIESFTSGAVTRPELFPNDWRRIWPELAAYEAAGQVSQKGVTNA